MAKRKNTIEEKGEKKKTATKKATTKKSDNKGKKKQPDTSVEETYGHEAKAQEGGQEAQGGDLQPDPNVKYSDKDLKEFKENIMDSRQEALEELQMLKDRLEDLTNYDFAEESMIYSMHMAEQGSEAQEKEKTYAQIQRINEYLKKLDDALQRIDNKTYGICRVCNILIAKERLLAVPITTLSASYKIHQKCPEDGIDRIEPLNS